MANSNIASDNSCLATMRECVRVLFPSVGSNALFDTFSDISAVVFSRMWYAVTSSFAVPYRNNKV